MNNLQAIFDTVVSHLRQQGCKALSEEGFCKYRVEDTNHKVLKCAAGCLIPESDYQETFEGMPIDFDDAKCNTYSVSRYFYSQYNEDEVSLISKLQYIHDNSSVENWENKFQALAELKNLQCNPA